MFPLQCTCSILHGSVHSSYTARTAVDLQCTLHYTAGTLHFGLGSFLLKLWLNYTLIPGLWQYKTHSGQSGSLLKIRVEQMSLKMSILSSIRLSTSSWVPSAMSSQNVCAVTWTGDILTRNHGLFAAIFIAWYLELDIFLIYSMSLGAQEKLYPYIL